MGKKQWTEEEEEALRGGVARHGLGKWKRILSDSEFGPPLLNRSNNDIKDKWRNLVVRDYKEELKSPKAERRAANSQSAATPGSSAATTKTSSASSNAPVEEQPSIGSQDAKKYPQERLREPSSAGQKKKKKKNIPKKNPAKKEVKRKTKPLSTPSGVGKAAVGTVRRSARIVFSRFRSIPPNNRDDPIVID